MEIQPYEERHASSIVEGLFTGVDVEVFIKQRRELLSPGRDEVFSVSCVAESKVIGVCTGVRKRWYGERHRIEMVQVVVHESFQRMGIARLMMQVVAKHFAVRGVEMVQISVEGNNSRAIKAYERIGFARFGMLKHGLKYAGDKYSDEIMMAMGCGDLICQ